MAEMTDEERQALNKDIDRIELTASQALGTAAALFRFVEKAIPFLGISLTGREVLRRFLEREIEECERDAAASKSTPLIESRQAAARACGVLKRAL